MIGGTRLSPSARRALDGRRAPRASRASLRPARSGAHALDLLPLDVGVDAEDARRRRRAAVVDVTG